MKLSNAMHSPQRHVARLSTIILLAFRIGDSLSPSEWAKGWMTDIVGRFQVGVTDFDLLQSAKTSSGDHLDPFKWVQSLFTGG